MSPLIIAHRTCMKHAPENSLAGIRKAAKFGADAVEVDVQRTLDGVPVLAHDRLLYRSVGLPLPTWLLPLPVLRRFRRGRGGEPVPTLAEALAALPDGMKIAIDVKQTSAMEGILEEVRRAGFGSRSWIWSDSDPAVQAAAREATGAEVSLLRKSRQPEDLRRFLDDAVSFGANGVSVDWRAVNLDLVDEAHLRGLAVYSLAPDIETTLAHIEAGIDGAITDWPAEVRSAIRS